MATVDAFRVLEESLSKRLIASAFKYNQPLYQEIEAAMKLGQWVKAEELANKISLAQVVEENKKYIEYISNLAMIFGASLVTNKPGTSVVGLGYEKLLTTQLGQSFQQMLLVKGEDYLRQTAVNLSALERAKREVSQDLVFKFSEAQHPRDEKGRLTDKESGQALRAWHGTQREVLDQILKEGLQVVPQEQRNFGEAMFYSTTDRQGVYITTDFGVAKGFAWEAARHAFQKVHNRESVGQEEYEEKRGYALILRLEIPQSYVARESHEDKLVEDSLIFPHGIKPQWIKGAMDLDGKVIFQRKAEGDVVLYVVIAIEPPTKDTEQVQKFNPYHDELEVAKADDPTIDLATGQRRRILGTFESFMEKSGKAYFNVAASLHTSRVSAYGFTAEANALGLEEYQINEQQDSRTCAVCSKLHGRRFKVADARSFLDVVTRVVDPEALKQLQPWPKQTKEEVDKLSSMTSDELVAKGWHTPPFHIFCRGLLGRVGKVPALEDIGKPPKERWDTTRDDFKAVGAEVSEDVVDIWNKVSPLAPQDVFAALLNRPSDGYLLDGISDYEDLGYMYQIGINVNDSGGIDISTQGPAHGLEDVAIAIAIGYGALKLKELVFGDEEEEDQILASKTHMRNMYLLSKDLDVDYITADTSGYTSYAFAKYGFIPTPESWEKVKKQIANKDFDYLSLSKKEAALLTSIYASQDPGMLLALADAGGIGELLLPTLAWEGALDLNNPEAIKRFLTYFGITGDE